MLVKIKNLHFSDKNVTKILTDIQKKFSNRIIQKKLLFQKIRMIKSTIKIKQIKSP